MVTIQAGRHLDFWRLLMAVSFSNRRSRNIIRMMSRSGRVLYICTFLPEPLFSFPLLLVDFQKNIFDDRVGSGALAVLKKPGLAILIPDGGVVAKAD
jgi:hypothetical protein